MRPEGQGRRAGIAAEGRGGDSRYKQELSRSISVLGNIVVTLSGTTPAASVFVIAPVALFIAGSGSFLAFVLAAVVGLLMAFCWAELGNSYPIAGGDYALVWHSFKGRTSPLAGPLSFITFALYVDFMAFIPATIALGAGTYFGVVANVDPRYVGAVIMVIAAAFATRKIRFNTVVTSIFLGIELAALLILTVLGLSHARNWGSLVHPVVAGGHGLTPVAFSVTAAAAAIAIFSYAGYQSAVNYSEETKDPRRNVARAILWALAITVAAELIPFTAVIVGAPSLAKLTSSAVPFQYFIEATSNSVVYDVVSIGIVLAILNAVIAQVLGFGRILYSSGRDRAWPGPVSLWVAAVHPRFRSPWVATVLLGVVGVVMCLTVSLTTLANLTGASLVADYALIAVAAIAARLTRATAHASYKMPLWPLPPLLALASLGYVFTQQTRLLIEVTLITMGIGLVYWAMVILPQRGRAWNLREAPVDEPAASSVENARPAR
ncbi:APC family permease [Trebonia sp.]|uniref:APC family permease n=1 Tax=Trebonia sp. TaxID=2767075 RepID=UPI00261751D3|nr:APC family permease [Trebonia sp.]